LPTLRTTAVIVGASNGGTPITAGSTVASTTPTLTGSISTALLAGQTLRVLRNGVAVGTATVSGLSWSFTETSAPNGALVYRVRVEALPAFGASSNSFAFSVDTVASSIAANVIGVPFSSTPIGNNAFTTDTTPDVRGALAGGTLAVGDVVSVLRNGAPVGSATVSGTNWAYAETAALALGDYTYTARVVDVAGNLGAVGSNWTVRITSLPTTTITQLFDNPGGSVLAPGAVTTDTTPRIAGTLNTALLAGQLVRVLRNGTAAGTATVSGTGWTFDDTVGASVSGTQTYTARAEAGALLGVASAGYAILIDNAAPAQTANVTGITDDFLGPVPNNGFTTDSTPQISGSLSAALNATTGSTESLQVLRNGVVLAATAAISFPNWSVTDPGPMTAGTTYTYSARVVDAAGNQGALGATRAATYDATTRTASISGAFNGSTAIGAGTSTSDTTPEIRGSVNAALLPGQWVRVLRGPVAVSGQITPSGGTWAFTDSLGASVSQGVAYTARVESASSVGAQSLPYAFTIDNVAPSQTFTVAALSAGASIALNASIDSLSPTVRVTLSSALDTNVGTRESLVITRVLSGGTASTTVLTPTLQSCTATPPNVCFEFVDTLPSVLDFAQPPFAANTALPTQTQYSVVVRDVAQNQTPAQSFTFKFDYLPCLQARADAANSSHGKISASSVTPPAIPYCFSCHAGSGTNPTPVGALVPVPASTPAYWCRRPS
jgi:hypothetical protein